MMEEDKIITVVDIGSSKIAAIIARVFQANEIEILGIGIAESVGIRAGSITNLEETVNGIRAAIEEAELMAGFEVESALINVTGKHVKGENSIGVIAITNRDRVIGIQDVSRVIDAAQSIRIPNEQEVLHVLSKEFKVDDQHGIKDPTGMIGVRLEVDVHIVTGHTTQIYNFEKAVRESGIAVADRVLSALANSASLLTEGEKELGVAVVDIGAGIVDIIVYVYGGVAYTSTICIGAQHITHDISIGLKTPLTAAEMIKRRYGAAVPDLIDPIEQIEVPTVGNRPPRNIARKDLAMIVEARSREILEMVNHELLKSGQKDMLAGGIVLCGGGSLLQDLSILAEEVIGLSTTVGYPKNLRGMSDKVSSPVFATATGLLQYAARYKTYNNQKMGTAFFTKIKMWLRENL